MKPCCIWAQYLTVKRNPGNKKSENRQRIPPGLRVSLIFISSSMLEMPALVEKRGASRTGPTVQSTGGMTGPFHFRKTIEITGFNPPAGRWTNFDSFVVRRSILFFFGSNSMQPPEMVKLISAQLQNPLNITKKVRREQRWRGRQAEKNFTLPTEIENRNERVTALNLKS